MPENRRRSPRTPTVLAQLLHDDSRRWPPVPAQITDKVIRSQARAASAIVRITVKSEVTKRGHQKVSDNERVAFPALQVILGVTSVVPKGQLDQRVIHWRRHFCRDPRCLRFPSAGRGWRYRRFGSRNRSTSQRERYARCPQSAIGSSNSAVCHVARPTVPLEKY